MWFDIITNFGLNTYLTREVSRYQEQARRYLINTSLLRLGLAVLGVPLLVGFIAVRQTLVAALTAPAAQPALLALVLLYVGLVPNSIATGFSALFYAHEKAEFPAAVTTISTLLKVGLGTGVLLAGLGIVGLAASAIAVNIITLVILGVLAWREIPALKTAAPSDMALRAEPERSLRRKMLSESWPLMVNHLLATLFFKIDVPLMEAILGNETLGLYSTGYKYLDALNVIPAMFTMALFPIISRKAVEDRAGFVRFFRLGVKILMLLVLPAAIIATLGARELVLLLGGPEYLPGGMLALQLMAWSMVIGWVNSLSQYVLIALNQQRYLMRAYMLALAFNLIANLLLMQRFGYQASALLHTAAELMLFIPFTIRLHQQIGRLNWWGMLGKPLLAAACTAPVAALLFPVSRLAALAGALLVYGVISWRLKIFDAEEREVMAPLLGRKR
jgi:O-antigen/teichoic acid export membrane protein